MSEVLQRIEKTGPFLVEAAADCEAAGRLTDDVADRLRWTGVTRMLQPSDFGGAEAHPAEFFEAVMAVGAHSGAAGWVSGVVGVHPWELGLVDPSVQEQIWGEDADTWIASPYAPMGTARPEGDGWVLSGRWSFSSGTDHCQWIVLGGFVTDAEGQITDRSKAVRHFILPRSDYTIVPDSWNVMGLEGTGSNDIVIDGAYLPAERVVDPEALPGRERRSGNPLYRLPLATMFAGAITAGTLGLAQGALDSFVEDARVRVDSRGASASTNPYQLSVLGEASADIAASRLQFLTDINRVYDIAASGAEITPAVRLELRRNQVRSVRRAIAAVESLFIHAGGSSLRREHAFQRFWRDLHAAANHSSNSAEPMYQGYGLNLFGQPVPPGIKY
ncbi:hydroxylase [Nocardioides sp. Kera G14]|uniref:hydroxylase n=1 Tax=Nocardioides sp. Kera G14 TaxID=2884264 RepID=UPI001D0F5260|nr:hydroxylase [Nocardioides sp. Kera G14]UDY24598.1 hydroxylase [Nocardioides sp. Kera G14]